ncbi:glycosyltransferase [Methylomarinum sp. Ch1-1]|uniref:Glycosyltransferase n=1 Tax=Methylomarinum roseum TaxID=3067653 RepID=A0AAU7NQB6_9GAMM
MPPMPWAASGENSWLAMKKNIQLMPPEFQAIEVLICTHNRSELLQRAINFLNKAERPRHLEISLFIVANACTDETHQFLRHYQEESDPDLLPLKWLEEPLPGKSNALNSAIPKLTASVIAMVDDDHRVDTQYFMAIDQALTQYPDADFYCGKIIPDWNGSEPQWVHDQGKYRIYPLPVPRFELGGEAIQVTRDIAVPGGGNLVVKKKLFKLIGDFSTDFGPVGHNLGGAEDLEWVIRAYKAGAHLQYIPNMAQYHYVDSERMTLCYVMKKAYERSSSTIRLKDDARNYAGLFPRYLIRKLMEYSVYILLSLSCSARRFYLVRLAATLGEIKGFLMAKRKKA